MQPRVLGFVHLTHPASAEPVKNPVTGSVSPDHDNPFGQDTAGSPGTHASTQSYCTAPSLVSVGQGMELEPLAYRSLPVEESAHPKGLKTGRSLWPYSQRSNLLSSSGLQMGQRIQRSRSRFDNGQPCFSDSCRYRSHLASDNFRRISAFREFWALIVFWMGLLGDTERVPEKSRSSRTRRICSSNFVGLYRVFPSWPAPAVSRAVPWICQGNRARVTLS
jgi:hypothetical protein